MAEHRSRRVRRGASAALAIVVLLLAGLLWSVMQSTLREAPTPSTAARPDTSVAPTPVGRDVEPAENPVRGGSVFGTVVDHAGSSVSNARICAIRTPTALPLPITFCTQSNQDGEYRLDLPASTWALGASASGLAPSRFGPGRRSNLLRLREGEIHRFDFALLEPGRRVTGVVRDALGGTIPDALVTIGAHPGLSEPGALVRSDDDGIFELVVPDRIVMVTAYAPGYFPGSTSVAWVQSEDVELVLSPETLLRGVVVWDADSTAVAGAEVFASGSGSQTTSDEAGRFELSSDPSRSNVLIAAVPLGYASLEIPPQPAGEHQEVELRLMAGADLEVVVMIGERRDTCLEGYVRFESPLMHVWGYMPVAGEPVEVRGLPLGPHSMRVVCRGTMTRHVSLDLVEGFQRVEVVLERAPILTGRVLAADGSPAAMTPIVITGELESGSDVTSVEGEFVVDYLPPGIYAIEARSQQLGEGSVVTVDTRGGDIEVELHMEAWAQVRGRVIDTQGHAVVGLPLSLVEQPEPRFRGLATTASDGSFVFSAVRSGELGLFAGGLAIGRAGETPEQDHVAFVHDVAEISEIEMVAETRERVIELRVIDESGEPVPGVRVGLVRLGENRLEFSEGAKTSDLEGKVVFRDVPEGDLGVRWPDGEIERIAGNDSLVRWPRSAATR